MIDAGPSARQSAQRFGIGIATAVVCTRRALDGERDARRQGQPHGDYFRALEAITPEDNAIYADYVERIVASGNEAALHVKLADFQDTCDLLNEARTPELKAQLRDRYEPARDRLLAVLEKTPPAAEQLS